MADFEPRSDVAIDAGEAPAPELPADAFPGCTARHVPRSEILRARGIAVSDQGLGRVPEIDATPVDAVVRAALACHDEADFLARLRRRR